MQDSTPATTRPLFVYGTLKPGGSNYTSYLEGRTTSIQPATLVGGALFTDGQYPYLVINPAHVNPEDRVQGVIAVLAPEHYAETLARIDWLEDYKPNSPWSMYDRIVAVVEVAGTSVEVWTYIGGPQTPAAIQAGRMTRIPGETWPSSED